MDAEVQCPYCGEWATIFVDPSGGAEQTYVEDCPACCRPWLVHAREEERGGFAVGVARQDGMEG
jgi:hypothetical protein